MSAAAASAQAQPAEIPAAAVAPPAPAKAAKRARAAGKAGKAPASKARYYFHVSEVKSAVADEATKAVARELLDKELAGRPEFTSELEGTRDPEALAAELRRRKLQGFDVSMEIGAMTREPKPPRPGGRLKQLAVTGKVSVFGTTIHEAKLAFGGEGEATVEAEIVERKMEEEAASLTRDVLTQAIKQAVDQAVAKLSMPKSKPFNESKKRR